MKKLIHSFGLTSVIAAGLLAAGCLVSGTFIIVSDFDMTVNGNFYFYPVDITDEGDWEDHKDDIDQIDVVGAEFTIENSGGATTFSVYIDDYMATAPGSVPGTASAIIEDFAVPAGTTTITYAQSLGIIKNVARLKALAKVGKFSYFATSTGVGGTFEITNSKVIITFSASGS